MDIQAEKLELIKMLISTNNPQIIETIKRVFKSNEPVDFWNDLTREQQYEIDEATREIAEGKVHDYETVMKSHR